VEFGDEDGQIPIYKIARKAEEYRLNERVTYKMIQKYIESMYNCRDNKLSSSGCPATRWGTNYKIINY